MTVMNTKISWTDSTGGFATGCTQVSAGCDFCYAKTRVENPYFAHIYKGRPFSEVVIHPERLKNIARFKPMMDDGQTRPRPRMVFVNSMSDWAHEDIPLDYTHKMLDHMEEASDVVFQLLSKRPVQSRRIMVERYKGKGLPANFWVGLTVEDNRVAGRLKMLRDIKQRCGGGTLMVSVEPIVGDTNQLDFTDMDWVITGGESGSGARIMTRGQLVPAIEGALRAGAAVWHKQNGQFRSHPNIDQVPHRRPPGVQETWGVTAQMAWMVANGWEVLPDEKGGATVDRATYRALPASYAALRDKHFPAGLI